MPKTKTRPVEFVHTSSVVIYRERGIVHHLTATARDGSLWERYSDWTEGRWEEIARPVSASKPTSSEM